MKTIITLGDNCVDVYPALQKAFPGGNAVNVAVYATRYGMRPAYIGWVGSDDYGQLLRRELAVKGVDISHVHVRHGVTAQTFVTVNDNERVLGDYIEGVMADFDLDEGDIGWIQRFDLVHAGIWGRVEQYYPRLRRSGRILSFDFADKWDSPLWRTLPAELDYAFASADDDTPVVRDRLKNIVCAGARTAIATLGANGSLAFDGRQFYRHGILPVKVVDTMGAGDAFIAGFLCAVAQEGSIDAAMRQGTESAALTIQYPGAW
ncbi:fructoselysine 6-kinase [Sodalis sp. C49]|uniref:fructoselysine 6-kinase n=1 Tax=Sodalis sp. C49 TaxID=3228929 RepID=UPI003965A959